MSITDFYERMVTKRRDASYQPPNIASYSPLRTYGYRKRKCLGFGAYDMNAIDDGALRKVRRDIGCKYAGAKRLTHIRRIAHGTAP